MDILKAASRFTDFVIKHAPKTHPQILREIGDALEGSGYDPMVSTFHESVPTNTTKTPSLTELSNPEYSDIGSGEITDEMMAEFIEGDPAAKAKSIESLYNPLENVKGDRGLSPVTRRLLEAYLELRKNQKPEESFKPSVIRGRLPPKENLETAANLELNMLKRSFGWAKLI
jgi:hypothetical protein